MSEELLKWPDWMPVPDKSGYGYEPVDRSLSSEMEIGIFKRVEFDADENTISLTVLMDQDEIAWFETFERDCLKQGSRWFEMPVQYSGAVCRHKARLKGRPKFGNLEGAYTLVSMSLEISRRDLLDDDVMDLLNVMSPREARRIAFALHRALTILAGKTSIPDNVWQ